MNRVNVTLTHRGPLPFMSWLADNRAEVADKGKSVADNPVWEVCERVAEMQAFAGQF